MAFDQFMATDNQVIALYRSGRPRAAAQANDLVLSREISLFTEISSAISRLVVSVAHDARQARASATSAQSSSRATIILVSLVAVLSAALGGFFVVRSISRKVGQIIERMAELETAFKARLVPGLQALAGGDLTVKLEAGTKPASGFATDELGRIMTQAENFRAALLECYEAYNMTVANLRSLIGDVTSTASSVGAESAQMSSNSEEAGRATGEIAQAIGDVAQGAARQVNMVETARRTAAEVAAAVKESAQRAEQTAQVAIGARDAAQDGVQAAGRAHEAMRSVRDSSQEVTDAIGELASKSGQIGVIVATITGIAEQTNLLALNAAIEAARAGEQGRGFAVVAEEVRKLAEQAQDAAGEISRLVGAIQDKTGKTVTVVEAGARRIAEGAAVVEQTREAFLSIGQAVDDITAQIEQIAASAQQITASASSMQDGIAEIEAVAEHTSASTEQVSSSTEQTSASAQEIATSARELAGNAEHLNQLVARFQINHDSDDRRQELLQAAQEAHEAWSARLRDAIETGASSISVDQAGSDDRCAFGSWLHAPGEFRDREPQRWQQIHDLHEEFHRNAAQVLELAITGRQTEAAELAQAPEFVNIQRHLRDALQTAIPA